MACVRKTKTSNPYLDYITNMSESEVTNRCGHTMLELLVVGTWIVFIAYGTWFFSLARREREEYQKFLKELGNSHAPRIPDSFVNDSTISNYSFVNGLAIGLGVAFLETFVILWMSIFYASQLSAEIIYEKMFATLIYPMLSILTTGMVLLTMGVLRQYLRTRT